MVVDARVALLIRHQIASIIYIALWDTTSNTTRLSQVASLVYEQRRAGGELMPPYTRGVVSLPHGRGGQGGSLVPPHYTCRL